MRSRTLIFCCRVSSTYIVKVADFGLSKDIYEKDYYQALKRNRHLPMKWMAIESLKEGRYTVQSDVVRLHYTEVQFCGHGAWCNHFQMICCQWSYGVTMWEVLTSGATPYPGISNNQVKDYLATGKRLEKPEICPNVMYVHYNIPKIFIMAGNKFTRHWSQPQE